SKFTTNLPKHLELKDINFIVFPDWNQEEEHLYQNLYCLVRLLLTHPENNRIALFIDTTKISEEDANLCISSILSNLISEEQLEKNKNINVFLVGKLDQIQWRTLTSFLKARIVLDSENSDALLTSGTEIIPAYTVNQLIEFGLIFIGSAKPYKLNIGCGNVRFDGWINIDIEQNYKTVDLVCDARQKLPFDDNSCELIYNEHFLEHLTLKEGLFFLKECYRILKPEGILRIAMPSLEYVVQKYMSDDWRNQEWLKYPEYQFIKTRAEMLNISMRWWGHQWLYDTEELYRRLTESGYINIQEFAWGKSNTPELRNRETRVDSILICESQVLK
ncbi:methyltransferase domain-containing protein, partial [Trichormus variabilis PNB]